MGDRGNIAVIGHDTRDQVWFYGHWSGHRMPAVLQQAVREGKGRWQDPSYFARIVFCRLLPPDDRYFEETSYGISTGIGDNEHPIMVADCVKQQVYTIAEKQLKGGQVPADYKPKEVWTFEEYAKLEKLPWGSMEGQLKEQGKSPDPVPESGFVSDKAWSA